ncbi:hypothetical protein SeMB42_g03123 [Synchytrium endobioticum]|uniref:Major facilitator superfamily (MFS) profile domain-containing protein n=1 Tax=Synchytrium endobioticum TaxID=286115 RepID=A0A507D9S6_9FUNG|nr:hypothetical protein SeLEV6574_g05833 [Synchytrium endobioticum]TPX48127.1 hypothetical protein SeMB42_g03123 [Synchytrium endobioticum]
MTIYAYTVASIASMGGFLIGYELGVIDQLLIMDSFSGSFGITHENESETHGNVTSIFVVGAIFGCLGTSYLADKIGRKPALCIACGFYILGTLIQACAMYLWMIYVGRIVQGVAEGMLGPLSPLFISEASPTALRGTLTSFYHLFFTAGIVVASCLDTILIKSSLSNEFEWRITIGIQSVLGALVMLLIFLCLPESPRYLAKAGRLDDCRKVLARLLAQPSESTDVSLEYNDIKLAIQNDEKIGQATWLELFKPVYRSRLVIVLVYQAVKQISGIVAILFFAAAFFQRVGFSKEDSATTLVIINSLVLMLASVPSLYLIERAGRRSLLIYGSAAMALFQIGTSVCMKMAQGPVPEASWGSLAANYLTVIAFSLSMGPVVWVVQQEFLPLRVRSKAGGVGALFNWSFTAIAAKLAPILNEKLGWAQFLVYSGCCLFFCIFTCLYVPETKGVKLEEIDELFGQPAATREEEVVLDSKPVA